MHDWHEVRIYGCGLQPHMWREWLAEPAWTINALYAQADEVRRLPGSPAPRHLFWNRHLDRRFHLEYPRSTRAAARPVSHAIGDAGREWDIVQEHLDRYLAAAGLTRQSPPLAIAQTLAAAWRREPYFAAKEQCPAYADERRQLSHPVEGLLYQSHCVGCAQALAALADAAGLAVRTIGLGGHRVAEIRVGGRWYMTENSCRHPGGDALAPWFPASFLAVTLHPERFADRMPADKPAKYLNVTNGQYHFQGGTWTCPVTLRLAAGNAVALYPELHEYGFKSEDGRRLPLVNRAGGFYWENGCHPLADRPALRRLNEQTCPFPITGDGPAASFLYYPLRPGERLRQSVWLDHLDGLLGLELVLPVAPEPHLATVPDLGRRLIVQVGDWQTSLHDAGAWPGEEPDQRGLRRCVVTIPAAALQPRAVNWLVLRNDSGTTLQAPFLPAALEPYLAPWAPAS
jgi:hypothetical protein